MLRFLVHDPAILASGARDVAHLVGPDDQPLRGEVAFAERDGRVEIAARIAPDDIAAIALPVLAGGAGLLMLQTCIAPPRDEPYRLALELARHRIKHFVQKCEEWQMWDPGLSRGAMRLWEESRALFAQAMLARDDATMEGSALRSLEVGIEASEHLAMAHAEILLHRRYGAKPASSTTLGTVIRPSTKHGQQLDETLVRDMDVLHLRADWRELEPKKGRPDFAQLDRWIEWAVQRKKPVMLGPVIDLREAALPDYARVFRHDYESFRDLAYDHVDRLATRYAGAVGIWNVASGLHANAFLELQVEQMIDLARRTVVAVRQKNRKANTLMELVDVFGDEGARRSARRVERVQPWRFAELLQQEGIPVSALGIRMTPGRTGSPARDVFQVSCMLDRFVGREVRVMLTAFGVPASNIDPSAGWWREAWTPDTQAAWAGRVFHVVLSKPFVEAVFWAEAADVGGDADGMGLFDGAGRARAVLAKLVGLRRRLRTPLGPRPAEAPADA